MPCIFCEIVKGNIPAYKVHEDAATLAFLDIHPINEGHVLVIPKKHEPELQDLDGETYLAVMKTVQKVSQAIKSKLSPARVGMKVEGWDVPHAHIHVVPLLTVDDITSKRAIEGNLLSPSEQELRKTQETLTI